MILLTSLFLTFARADDSGKILDAVRGDPRTKNKFPDETGLKFILRMPVDDSRMCQYAISSSIKWVLSSRFLSDHP